VQKDKSVWFLSLFVRHDSLVLNDSVELSSRGSYTERIEVEISLKTSLSESEKKEIWDNLYRAHITNIDPGYFCIIHCP
jgi:hypothetical protein